MIYICVNHLSKAIRDNALEIGMPNARFKSKCISNIGMCLIGYKGNWDKEVLL